MSNGKLQATATGATDHLAALLKRKKPATQRQGRAADSHVFDPEPKKLFFRTVKGIQFAGVVAHGNLNIERAQIQHKPLHLG